MGRIGCLAFTSWHSIHHLLRHEVWMVSVATYAHQGVSDRGACGALGWINQYCQGLHTLVRDTPNPKAVA